MTTPLPPQDPGTPDDQQPGEAALAALYRQLPQSEPGPALDAAVLRAAAQALAPDEESPTVLRERRKAERERGDWVHPKAVPSTPPASPSSAGSRRRSRWLIALSSAATLVLAAGLVWHMRGLPSPESASTAANSVAPAAATAAAPAPRVVPSNAAMPLAEAVPPPPPPEPLKQPPPRMAVAQLQVPAATAMRKATTDKSAEQTSSPGYVGGLVQPEPVSAPAAPQEPASDLAAKPTSPTMAAAAPTAAMAAAPAPAPVEEVTTNIATAPNAADTPAQELDKIQQLFAQHQDDEARQRLEAFHRLHPSWDLPLELRAQLRQP